MRRSRLWKVGRYSVPLILAMALPALGIGIAGTFLALMLVLFSYPLLDFRYRRSHRQGKTCHQQTHNRTARAENQSRLNLHQTSGDTPVKGKLIGICLRHESARSLPGLHVRNGHRSFWKNGSAS